MSVWSKLKYGLTNHCETRENHEDEQLQSRYYKTTAASAIKAVKELIASSHEYELLSVSEERGEFSVATRRGRKAFIVITVISVRPFETAIDFSVTTDTKILPFDFGWSRRIVIDLYQKIDQRLPYIGSGING
ncbi:cytosolic protein [Anoxybacteroides rupiense]|uniref:cytosolic protein n=1 Tax=Anoxybacteroides rupiense TaxID=311460 RepID=UPI001BAB2A0D|nr:cytosolic protein [Anoxybacillus rupiensis]MBS2771980.1 cytosolic protein [Anoxybacillus rupiensis]